MQRVFVIFFSTHFLCKTIIISQVSLLKNKLMQQQNQQQQNHMQQGNNMQQRGEGSTGAEMK